MKKGVREEILLGMAAKKIQTEWLTQHSPRGPWDVWYNLPIHEWWDVFVYGKCVIYRYINIPTMSHFPLDAGIFFPRGFGPSTGSPCQVGMPRTSYPALRFARWWFSNFLYFHPYLGKWSILTHIFEMGGNHQLVKLEHPKNPAPQKLAILTTQKHPCQLQTLPLEGPRVLRAAFFCPFQRTYLDFLELPFDGLGLTWRIIPVSN